MYKRNDALSDIFLIHFLLLYFETEYENWFDHIHDQGVCYFHEGNVPKARYLFGHWLYLLTRYLSY